MDKRRCGAETLQKRKKNENIITLKGGGSIINRIGWNCLGCDPNRKWFYQSNQNNHNP